MSRKPKTKVEDVKPLCLAPACGELATGLYPVHEDNPQATGEESPGSADKWGFAPLCDGCWREAMQANVTMRMPAAIVFPAATGSAAA